MKLLNFPVALLVAFLTISVGQAQRFTKKKMYWALGGNISTSNYVGDIAPTTSNFSTDYSKTRYNLGGQAVRRFHPRMSARIGLNWIRLQGDDATSAKPGSDVAVFRYRRNLNFRNDLIEASAHILYDFLENRGAHNHRPRGFIPYLFAGVAVMYHSPKMKIDDKYVSLFPLKTEGTENGRAYSRVAFAIPFGLGVRKALTSRFDLSVEVNYRYCFTDELDDVSTTYPKDMFDRTGDALYASSGGTYALQKGKTTSGRSFNKEAAGPMGTIYVKSLGDGTYLVSETPLPGYTLFASGYAPVLSPVFDANGLPVLNGGQQVYTTGISNIKEKRGDPGWDHFFTIGASLSYIVNVGVKCPKFR
ncbi:MAG: DUF6089 family protein [Cytophagales bacterium]|nr:DUF6089 family protein [Cytophagales bacterium]MDW8385060.1 DUF6089 family protein [Flammeovirgaceae bacterium]